MKQTLHARDRVVKDMKENIYHSEEHYEVFHNTRHIFLNKRKSSGKHEFHKYGPESIKLKLFQSETKKTMSRNPMRLKIGVKNVENGSYSGS